MTEHRRTWARWVAVAVVLVALGSLAALAARLPAVRAKAEARQRVRAAVAGADVHYRAATAALADVTPVFATLTEADPSRAGSSVVGIAARIATQIGIARSQVAEARADIARLEADPSHASYVRGLDEMDAGLVALGEMASSLRSTGQALDLAAGGAVALRDARAAATAAVGAARAGSWAAADSAAGRALAQYSLAERRLRAASALAPGSRFGEIVPELAAMRGQVTLVRHVAALGRAGRLVELLAAADSLRSVRVPTPSLGQLTDMSWASRPVGTYADEASRDLAVAEESVRLAHESTGVAGP